MNTTPQKLSVPSNNDENESHTPVARPVDPNGRGDLLAEIRGGMKLKPVSTPSPTPSSGRGDLLAEIRGGKKLKPVASQSVNIDLQQIDEADKKDLVSCIQNALLKIRKDVHDDSDDSDWE